MATDKIYKSRVQEQYDKEVVPYLENKFGYKNPMFSPTEILLLRQGGNTNEYQREVNLKMVLKCLCVCFSLCKLMYTSWESINKHSRKKQTHQRKAELHSRTLGKRHTDMSNFFIAGCFFEFIFGEFLPSSFC